MYSNYLKIHVDKNLKNYILSNFIFLSKKINIKSTIRFYFFYNVYNVYLAIFIIYNFWLLNNLYLLILKNKITILYKNIDFFIVFSIFLYPFLLNFKILTHKVYNLIHITFFIQNFFLNPLFVTYSKKYNLSIKKTFNIFNIALFLKKKQYFFLTFFFNFFQIPLFFLGKRNDFL